ncbi:MAG: ABC transporter ATP-binding protein/permease [Pseudobdellovibrio sp.]|nr:ABC transporter ATP-binding protein/permease [Pseudobdellovibrio sp.]
MQSDIRYVWTKLTKYKSTLVIIGLTGLIYSASKAFISHYVKKLMDSATMPQNLETLIGLGIGLAFVISISRYFHIFLMNMVSEKVTQDIRQQLQHKFLKLNLKFHNTYASGSGGLLSRTFNDVKIVQDGLRLFADIFTAPLMFVAVIFNLFYFDTTLAFSILFITPVILYALRQLSKTIKKYSVFGVEQLEKITGTIKESLDGVRTIQAFNLENFFTKRLVKQGDHFIEMRRKVHGRVELIGPINEFVATLILVAIVYYFSSRIAAGKSSFGVLMAYLTTIMQANEPIKKFQEAIVRIQESRVCADRIEKMLNEDSEVPESGKNLAFPKDWDMIEYKNIQFAYDSTPLIQNFNLQIKKGQTVAFVGESGSGKTTLANLLARFYDAQSGEITVGGVDTKDISLHDLRKNIGLVSQEVFLFSDTIETNIIAGTETGGHHVHEKVVASARAAHALTFIEKNPDKFNTLVGERGGNFSGGEKQRLAIARALYKDAPILILDEATSALDSVSEEQVQRGLDELMQGRTTLVIAHRLSTIQNADLILVMKRGQIVEKGVHKELLEKNGEYARLYYTQNRA